MMDTKQKLEQLRELLAGQAADAFILPVGDEFLGEYVPASAERLHWLTGFSGSAGLVAVTPKHAALFVDGRYTLQAKMEVAGGTYTLFNSGDKKPEQWLAEHMEEGQALAFDPLLHSVREMERIGKALAAVGVEIKPLWPNPVDSLWQDRPNEPQSDVEVHKAEFSGESVKDKVARVAQAVADADADFAVIAASDSVNWLLNIRGRDLAYSPVARAYAVIEAGGAVRLYIDSTRISAGVTAQLVPMARVREPDTLEDDLRDFGFYHRRVLLDPALTPSWFALTLKGAGAEVIHADDPCQLPKAIKNKVELEGIRRAHVRDGLAVVKFLHWLHKETRVKEITERTAAQKLLEFRKEAPEFVSPSFETIAGSGPHGAIVHYRVSEDTNRVLHQNELFLLDSGGQYPDGTTDITRTVVIGMPSREHCEHYTHVLKGHVQLALATFPEGTSGSQLDAIARMPLWQAGLDFDHGTGHGVGCFLNVHEGPQRISKRAGDAALKPGMILSNEPGYYQEGQYGIRIENLVAVVAKSEMRNGKARLGFDTLTCVPLERRLILPELLSAEEKAWLDAYHAWVKKTLSPQLEEMDAQWLAEACKELA